MKKKIQIAAGLVIGLGLLWLLFKDTNWSEVFDAIRKANASLLGLGMLVVFCTFFTRVLRWRYIVRTAKPVSFRHMFSATQIGFLANFTMPGRVGEVVRALVLARLAKLPFAKCFAMVALDRVTDLIGLVAVMIVTIAAYKPVGKVVIPREVFDAEITFDAALVQPGEIAVFVSLIVLIGAFVMLYVNQRLVLRISDACLGVVSKKLAAWSHAFLEHFAEGLHIFRSASDMAKSVAFSLLTWCLFLLSFQVLLWAFGIHGPWYTVLVLQVLLAVFIAVPGAPGFVGQFHVPIVIALVLVIPDMDVSKAKAVAIVGHLINVALVAATGVYCLSTERLGLLELTRESMQAEDGMGETGRD